MKQQLQETTFGAKSYYLALIICFSFLWYPNKHHITFDMISWDGFSDTTTLFQLSIKNFIRYGQILIKCKINIRYRNVALSSKIVLSINVYQDEKWKFFLIKLYIPENDKYSFVEKFVYWNIDILQNLYETHLFL